MKNPGLAAVLSFLVPGLGQLYNGRFLAALLWLVVTGVSWIGSVGLLGFVAHFLAAYFAYRGAQKLSTGPDRRLIPATG